MSDERTNANRLNTARSREPRTDGGKTNSSKNALNSGFFSRELVIKEEEQSEFEALRASVGRQFTPTTAMQYMALDQIVCFCWRCRLALRLEACATGPSLGMDPEDGEENAPKQAFSLNEWVGASKVNLRAGIRFLKHLREVVAESGLMQLEDGPLKVSVIKGFGHPFYDSLVEWRGFNVYAIQLQDHLDEHGRMFPSIASDPPQPGAQHRVGPDERLRWEMVLKLIDLKIQQLQDLLAANVSRQVTNAQPEVCPRFFATASRDLHAAVGWYLYLRDMKL